MIKYLVCMMAGAFVGVMFMCLCNIVDDVDDLAEAMEEPEEEEEPICPFCGGHLSDVRYDNGIPYRYCFGCFHEYDVTKKEP